MDDEISSSFLSQKDNAGDVNVFNFDFSI
jgi:hypothetical protein